MAVADAQRSVHQQTLSRCRTKQGAYELAFRAKQNKKALKALRKEEWRQYKFFKSGAGYDVSVLRFSAGAQTDSLV